MTFLGSTRSRHWNHLTGVNEYILYLTDGILLLVAAAILIGLIYATIVLLQKAPIMRFD